MASIRKTNGYVLHEDSQRVVIATGFSRKSNNPKTGNMLQVYILTRHIHPLDAVQNGKDKLICGFCPLRGARGKNRTCYVRVGNAPVQVWKAYHRGNYPKLPTWKLFRGRHVRFGAYGDPVFLPFTLLSGIAHASAGWTGYTHQWENPLYSAYKGYLMASVENLAGYAAATAAGWRTFRVSETNATVQGEIVCPNTTRGISCLQCGLCKGTARTAKNIVIEAHGMGKKNLTRSA